VPNSNFQNSPNSFNFQNSPILVLIAKQSHFLSNLQIGPKCHASSSVHMSRPNWIRGHMAGYIRPRVSESERGVHRIAPHQKHFLTFSLLSVGSNPNKLKKDWRTFPRNPNRFRSQLSQNQWNFRAAIKDSTESSSLSWCFCNSSIESIARSNEFNTITETLRLKRRRRRRRIQGFWTG